MPFDPTLGDSRESYDLAVALGYDWVERAHNGDDVTMREMVLEREPFTITDDGRHVIVREISVGVDGGSRFMRDGNRILRRVRLLPLPATMRG